MIWRLEFRRVLFRSVLTTAVACGSAATATSSVAGSAYDITCSDGVAANYDFTYVTGHLTVTVAHLTVTAQNKSREYGDANPAFTHLTTGFKNSETESALGTAPACNSTATTTSSVGGSPYAIVCSGGVSGNYDFSYADGNLTVTKAPLDVTANASSRFYGDSNPPFTASYGGFKNGQDIFTAGVTGSPSLTTTASESSSVGNYTITAAAGTLASGNYSFVFHDGTLMILKATLEVTANDKSRIYGDVNPGFDATITAFKNGETLATSGVTGTASCSSGATATSSVSGSPYAITCALGTLGAGNYMFHFNSGQLTITKAALTVMADNKSKLLNALNPALTASYSGFKNGETLASSGVTGSPSLTTLAVQSSPVGSYQITAAAGTLAAGNYSFGFVNGVLFIGYGFDGFLQPINDTAHTQLQMSVFKAGSTVPVKFQIKDANGVVVQASVLPQWVTPVQVGTTTAPIDETLYTDPATTGLTYRWDGSQY